MRQIWIDSEHGLLDGIPFEYGMRDFNSIRTTEDKIWVLKPKEFFSFYDQFLGKLVPTKILEVGVFEGGSAFFLQINGIKRRSRRWI
jgi:hypothetical protein